jgi:ATP-binding cassette, subfamily B (MDR/TAP), member 1
MTEPNGRAAPRDAMNGTNHSSATDASKGKKKKEEPKPQASMSETFDFVFQCGPRITWIFVLGSIGGVLNGLVYPALAYLFSSSFADISAATNSGLTQVRQLAFTFLVVGTYALVAATIQTWCFEVVSYHATHNLRKQWFNALLRQDAAYFDVNDVGGIAGQVGPSSNKYRRGLGRKFGEGIQFLTTGVGGLAFAFYSSWRVAFVVLSVVPLVSLTAIMVMQLNQSKGVRAAAAYKTAGGVAYSAVSAIKTVLSLNAIQTMIDKYAEATQIAYKQATGILIKQGFANGTRTDRECDGCRTMYLSHTLYLFAWW